MRTSSFFSNDINDHNTLFGGKLMNDWKNGSYGIFLTFVALDDDGKPSKVPAVILETKEEIKSHESGKN